MNKLQSSDFPAFFEAIYGYEPFPWQRMLVERVADSGWPEGIDLPTASGKTACIDVAVFVLAMYEQGGRLPPSSPARRRIFFVVDRRIVVDEAHRRAQALAEQLANPEAPPIIKSVADRLRRLAWGEEDDNIIPASERVALVASRLRGGTAKDERWRLSPAQPAVITSTVDQLGSRLLFRSYGSSNLSAPIEAALTACDSLILLDEAHCAVPFMQTARSVQRYAGEKWIEGEPIVTPLTFSILSATLPDDVEEQNIFPKRDERDHALDHPLLQKRIKASKPAELIEAKDTGEREEKLIAEVVKQAQQFVENGRDRMAIMVNRVARASDIEAELRQLTNGEKPKIDADLVLMTGRMRPIDRDKLVYEWRPRGVEPTNQNGGLQHWLGARENPVDLTRPIILVTTQCLEVGADFSFDALITECASLDALRQRFGRLNRLGGFDSVDAAVLIRKVDVKSDDKLDDAKPIDPIYGNAMTRTWNWLEANADEGSFDFGIAAVDALLPHDSKTREQLTAPSPTAPVMLPAHIDLLCQTAPQPTPDPDVAIFLHGPQHSVPEARVVFRADLLDTKEKDWSDAVALLPPLTAEALTLPLWLIQKWLAPKGKLEVSALSDVESQQSEDATNDATYGHPFVIWRGKRESVVSRNPRVVRPNETIVVPADEALADRLGHAFCRLDDAPLDVAENAYLAGRSQPILRLLPSIFLQSGVPAGLSEIEPLKALFKWSSDEERERGELPDLLSKLHQYMPNEDGPELPDWLKQATEALRAGNSRIQAHPAGGVILFGPPTEDAAAMDLEFGDLDDDLSAVGQPVPLSIHTEHVKTRVTAWAARCLPPELAQTLITAAEMHDFGKVDPRFQIILYGDELRAGVGLAKGFLLAKSDSLYRSSAVRRRLQAVAGLPEGFRHEMLSLQLAEKVCDSQSFDTRLRDLALHVIAAHHGHARPFATVVLDDELPSVEVSGIKLSHEQRIPLVPPHRLDSGVAERFWTLTRRYGWWGLAYLEAILRLADRAASAAETAASSSNKQEVAR